MTMPSDASSGVPAPPADRDSLACSHEARRHLLSLFPGGLGRGEFYELRALDCSHSPAVPGPRLYFRSITELADEAMRLRESWDVFFGVGLRRCPMSDDIAKCSHDEKGKDHVSRLTCAWGDFDVSPIETPKTPYRSQAQVVAALEAAELRPDILVSSGSGVHGYWLLDEPSTDLQRVEALNRAIRGKLGGDNAIDAARILRLAGTYNRKRPTPELVRLVRCSREQSSHA